MDTISYYLTYLTEGYIISGRESRWLEQVILKAITLKKEGNLFPLLKKIRSLLMNNVYHTRTLHRLNPVSAPRGKPSAGLRQSRSASYASYLSSASQGACAYARYHRHNTWQ